MVSLRKTRILSLRKTRILSFTQKAPKTHTQKAPKTHTQKEHKTRTENAHGNRLGGSLSWGSPPSVKLTSRTVTDKLGLYGMVGWKGIEW
jgi:hypothetical protein